MRENIGKRHAPGDERNQGLSSSRVRIRAEGRVQGVGFRYFVYRNAKKLGVKGWVKNTSDGAVEAVFEGEASGVENLVSLCRGGPPGASVEDLKVEREDFRGEFKEFGLKL